MSAKSVLNSLSILAVLGFSPLTWHPYAIAQAPPIPDYQVKATFLFQFSQFVDWPAETFSGPQTELVIGILGKDPFGSYLDQTVRNEKVKNHPMVVRRYDRLEDMKDCQVLFVSQLEAHRVTEIVASLKGRATLTVSDADGFADKGGIIQFVTKEKRVRLIVNLEAARNARLTISSKLLRPATVINAGAH